MHKNYDKLLTIKCLRLIHQALIISSIPLIDSDLKNNFEWINNIFYFDKVLNYSIYTLLCFLALWACITIVKKISNLLYVVILVGSFGMIMGMLNQLILFSTCSTKSLDIIVTPSGVITGALLFYFHLIYKYTNYFKPEQSNT